VVGVEFPKQFWSFFFVLAVLVNEIITQDRLF